MILGDICLTGIAQFQSGKLQKKGKKKKPACCDYPGWNFIDVYPFSIF